MKNSRKTYIHINESKTLLWPIITISTLALILVLIILLVFSMLDSVRNDVERKVILANITQAKAKLDKEVQERSTVQSEIAKLKEEFKNLNALKEFSEELNNIKNIDIEISNRIKKRLVDKKIIADSDTNIYIGTDGNLNLVAGYLFESSTSSIISANGQKALEVICAELEDILKDSTINTYIDFIEIRSHMANSSLDAENKTRSTQRATNTLNFIFGKSKILRETYNNKFITVNMLNSRLIDKTSTDEADMKNKRIEIAVRVDSAAYKSIVEKYSK